MLESTVQQSESVICIHQFSSVQSLSRVWLFAAAAAAKSLQSCPTLCDPIDSSPPGSPVPGILQARNWSGLPFPSPTYESEKRKWSHSVMSDSSMGIIKKPTRNICWRRCGEKGLTLCDPMNHSTPGLPVHHQLPEFTQTHVHWVGIVSLQCCVRVYCSAKWISYMYTSVQFSSVTQSCLTLCCCCCC